MAKLSSETATTLDVTAINLTRLVERLQQNLLKPDATTEHRLRTSPYERSKANTNLEYVRSLLLRAEQDAANIKVLTRKQDVQADLLRKRDVIDRVAERLHLIEESADDTYDDSSDGEDLLGEDTPSDDEADKDERIVPAPQTSPSNLQPEATPETQSTLYEAFPSTLRTRRNAPANAPQDTAKTSSTDTASTAMQEKMLTHNRNEQEALTTSLLSMAQALKASSKAFSTSLDSEKDILDRAGSGLEKNTSGLEAASKRMGYLRKMSEGKGWWGRMMLYAWIFGLMFLAFFIVAFMPKLRF